MDGGNSRLRLYSRARKRRSRDFSVLSYSGKIRRQGDLRPVNLFNVRGRQALPYRRLSNPKNVRDPGLVRVREHQSCDRRLAWRELALLLLQQVDEGIHEMQNGRLVPTTKGVAIVVARLPDLAKSLKKAMKLAIELGLLPPDDRAGE